MFTTWIPDAPYKYQINTIWLPYVVYIIGHCQMDIRLIPDFHHMNTRCTIWIPDEYHMFTTYIISNQTVPCSHKMNTRCIPDVYQIYHIDTRCIPEYSINVYICNISRISPNEYHMFTTSISNNPYEYYMNTTYAVKLYVFCSIQLIKFNNS